jgi:dTDP-4-dehydrorhamnose reductase
MDARDAQWVITGAGGMLATDLLETLLAMGVRARALPKEALDITEPESVARGIAGADIVVNCAAYTAVDPAEADEAMAHLVNAEGAGILAQACVVEGTLLVHLSTDYVLAGTATEPYPVNAPLAPTNAYGRTKAAGERAVVDAGGRHLIVRTAWLYGAAGPCFPKTIARVGAEKGALEVVDDQVGQPTWTRDLSHYIVALVERDAPTGVYHGTSSGQTTWFEFAQEVCASAGLGDIVKPVPASANPRPATRPAWSVLDHSAHEALGVTSIGPWRERWKAAAAEVLGLDSSAS